MLTCRVAGRSIRLAVMSLCTGRRAKRRGRLFALAVTMLLVCGLAFGRRVPPARADWNQCAPSGLSSSMVLPKDLTELPHPHREDPGTTISVESLSSVNVGTLGLGTPGVLTVGTLSDAPPNVCINPTREFTGFDNLLLRAI